MAQLVHGGRCDVALVWKSGADLVDERGQLAGILKEEIRDAGEGCGGSFRTGEQEVVDVGF